MPTNLAMESPIPSLLRQTKFILFALKAWEMSFSFIYLKSKLNTNSFVHCVQTRLTNRTFCSCSLWNSTYETAILRVLSDVLGRLSGSVLRCCHSQWFAWPPCNMLPLHSQDGRRKCIHVPINFCKCVCKSALSRGASLETAEMWTHTLLCDLCYRHENF